MVQIDISADVLVEKLLTLSIAEEVCFLDSCGVGHLGSHLLIAGIRPVGSFSLTDETVGNTLDFLDEKLCQEDTASIFSISYDFGLKLQNLPRRTKEFPTFPQPDVFLAAYDVLVIHDYKTQTTRLVGNEKRFPEFLDLVSKTESYPSGLAPERSRVSSNFSRREYIEKVETIRELIRDGETYQTNLTQQLRAVLPEDMTPQVIFSRLRKSHPAPFSAFLNRGDDYVVSISPERFVNVYEEVISASPIKGTRPRGKTAETDAAFRSELISSVKDRAENTMIVDLLRNDIGRICEFGSVQVENLCDLEEHPTLFHLVSTVSGKLRSGTRYSEIIEAIFPCGSITGCPKIRTMEIIDELETADRGLSMGAIGYCGFDKRFDLNVAIRTLVTREGEAIFNVGGGIVIDSDPESEYEESLLKAEAILKVINAKPV